MQQNKLDDLINRYEEVYFFVTRQIGDLLSDKAFIHMTKEQFFVIRYLTTHGRCPASELADICGVNRSAITAMVDRLVLKGYVKRVRDGEDRRVVYLEATESGMQAQQEGQAKIRNLVESYLQELEEEEVEAFVNIYEKISHIIREKSGGV